MKHHVRAVYQSPHTDEPNKVLISERISLNELANDNNFQVDFLDGSYLMLDEMDPEFTTWELYSGKKDKKGQEICQGDTIINIDHPRDISPAVTFEDGCFMAGYARLNQFHSSKLKVVGNIHV